MLKKKKSVKVVMVQVSRVKCDYEQTVGNYLNLMLAVTFSTGDMNQILQEKIIIIVLLHWTFM